MGYGIGGYIGMSIQSAFGTPTSSPFYIPFVSENLTENLNYLQIENLRTVYDAPNSVKGINNVTGDIVFEPHPIYTGFFLESCIGTSTSTLTTSLYVHEFLPRQTDFAADCALTPYTITMYKNVGSSYMIADAQIHTMAFEIVAGAIVRCTASVHGRELTKVVKATPTYIEADPYTWNQTSLQVAGSANGEFESATITIENPMVGVPTLNGELTEGKLLRDGFRNITVTGDQSFDTQAQEAKFRDGTLQSFKFTLTGDTVVGHTGQYNQLTFDMPDVKYTTFASPIAGAGRITAAYEGKALYDTTSSYALRVTLANTYAAY